MKYKIGEIITDLATGYRCMIVATKKKPWKPRIDPFMRKERFPEKGYDYLALIERKNENGVEVEYKGELNLIESQIQR